MATGHMTIPTSSALRRGEPLPEPTLDVLLSVLFQATSPDPSSLSRATEYLGDLEIHPSFWLLLLDLTFTQQCPLDASALLQEGTRQGVTDDDVLRRWNAMRMVAIIRFKNGVDRYWRSRVVNRVTITIPQEAKAQIRQKLLRCLSETDRAVALQASVAIARIARLDFPANWPNLFDDIQRAMVEAHANIVAGREDVELNRLVLLRAADICAKSLKELGAARLIAGKIRMTELSHQLLPTFVPMFQQYFEETMPSSIGNFEQIQAWSQSPSLQARIRTCHLLLKSVSHLAVADSGTISYKASAEGGNRPNFARELFRITPSMLQYLRDVRWSFIQFVRANAAALPNDAQSILSALQKHLLFFGKMYAALVGRERSKATMWEGWDELVMWYWQQAKEVSPEELSSSAKTDAGQNELDDLLHLHPTKLIVQSVTLMQRSLEEWKKANQLPDLFKDERLVESMVDVLVEKLMVLTQDDLELWQQDAEDWSVAEQAETYSMEVRPAAERLLLVLSNTAPSRQSKFVGDLLWRKFEEIDQGETVQDRTSIKSVLRRDAIYAALGRCRDEIDDEDQKMSRAVAERLVPQAALGSTADATWLLIRRRVAWLIWEWSEHIAVAHRAAVYEFLVSLLEDVPGKTDAAVRLEAARSLSALADSLEFDSDAFQPFIDTSLSRLATLAAGSVLHEMDSIKTCTNTMSILIERLGARIAQHLEQLATLVPHLWTLEDPECKARPSIIVFVSRLVRSVELIPHNSQGAGTSLHGIVEVIVRDSLSLQNSALLGKDALELWIRTLRSSSQMTEPLFRLLDLLGVLLDQPDFCPEACRVAQESTMMAAHAVISKHGAMLFEGFQKIVGDPRSPLILHPICALDIIVQALYAQGVDTMSWAMLLDQSSLFTMLVGSLLKVEETAVVTGYFVALLARLAFILKGTPYFFELVRSSASRLEGPQCDANTSVLKPLTLMWCERVETMASMRKRKMTCLGLAALLSSADGQRDAPLFDLLPNFIDVWMTLLGDTRQDVGPSSSEDAAANAALPHAPPSSPLLHRAFLQQAPDILQRSPSPALSIPGLEGIDDADDWLQETSPGKARLTELNRLDPVNTVRLTTFISESLRQAQHNGGESFQSHWSRMDPLVLDILQKDLAQ